jgi:hypothetical protein
MGDGPGAFEDLAHNRHVVLDAPIGFTPGLTVPTLDDLRARHADARDKAAAARERIDRRRRHCGIGWRARGQLHDGGAELDMLGFARQKRERGHRVGPVGFCRPYRVVAQRLGALHEVDGNFELGPRVADRYSELHGSSYVVG